MGMVTVRWLGGTTVEVPSQGRTGENAVKHGDTFQMPEAEARDRQAAGQVEIVTTGKKGADA